MDSGVYSFVTTPDTLKRKKKTWQAINASGVARFPFAANGKFQVSLNVGDRVIVSAQCGCWYRGVQTRTSMKGVFPANYIELTRDIYSNGNEQSAQFQDGKFTPSQNEPRIRDPIVDEIIIVLREWGVELKKLVEEHRHTECNVLKKKMSALVEWRKLFLSLPVTEILALEELKSKTIKVIEEGSRMLNLDMICRVVKGNRKGQRADEHNTGTIELYRQHLETQEREAQEHAKRKKEEEKKKASLQQRKWKRSRQQETDDAEESSGLPEGTLHFLLDVKACMFHSETPTEVYFSLYSADTQSFVTEEYCIELTNLGAPKNPALMGDMKTIFQALSKVEFNTSLYIVCRIYQLAVVKEEKDTRPESKLTQFYHARRPYGVGVCNISQLVSRLSEDEPFETDAMLIYKSGENGFGHLHENLITGGSFSQVPRAIGIACSFNLFAGDVKEIVEERNMQQVPITPMSCFGDIINPEDGRTDLYICLESAQFPSEMKNVEVRVVCCDDNGRIQQSCLLRGVGPDRRLAHEYKSTVISVSNSPRWNETILLCLDAIEPTTSCLVFLFFALNPKQPRNDPEVFGFAPLRVCESSGVVIENKTHVIPCTKWTKKNQFPDAATIFASDEELGKMQVRKSSLSVSTRLVSTRITQHVTLHNLINWRSYKGDLEEVLRFTYMDPLELVKFMRQIFDALFDIITSLDDKAIASLVYNALVFIIGGLVDVKGKKLSRFREVMDSYIEKHLTWGAAYKPLIECLGKDLSECDSDYRAGEIRKTMKAFDYIFKFVVETFNVQYRSLNEDVKEIELKQFRDDIIFLLQRMNEMMARTTPLTIIGAQTILMKHVSTVFDSLSAFFPKDVLGRSSHDFIVSIRPETKRADFVRNKLAFLRKLAHAELFIHPDSFPLVAPTVLRNIRVHMDAGSDLEQVVPVIGDVLDVLQSSKLFEGESLTAVLDILSDLLLALHDIPHVGPPSGEEWSASDESALSLRRKWETRTHVVACILCVVHVLSYETYLSYLVAEGVESAKSRITLIFDVIESLTMDNPFPEHWFVMSMYCFSVVVKTLRACADVLANYFLSQEEHDQELFSRFLFLCMRFLESPRLQLEKYSPFKQSALQARYGDMRVEVATLLKKQWESLGVHQQEYIKDMIEPILGLSKIPRKEVYSTAMNIYFSMMEREFRATGKFSLVQERTLDILDHFVTEGIFDKSSRELFIKTLEKRIRASPALEESGMQFLGEITELMELVAALQRYGTDEEDERTQAALKLIGYLRSRDRMELYFKYVHFLCDTHRTLGNFVEAALTLLYHAKELKWSDDLLEKSGEFHVQKSRDRKESLYRSSIEYLRSGRDYERAITLLREMMAEFEEVIYDYPKLKKCLIDQGNLFGQIAESERFYAAYYRVAYYGQGFEDSKLRDLEFVYRGKELERLPDFVDRISCRFPNAEILKTNDPPGDDIVSGSGQFIQINTLTPSSELEMDTGEEPVHLGIPHRILKYRLLNGIKVFSFSKVFRKRKGEVEETLDMWRRDTFLVSEDEFPTVHRRSRVVRKKERIVTPLELAVENVAKKSTEFEALLSARDSDGELKVDFNTLSMMLNGVIDAAINGGLKKYRNAFFVDEYLREHPGDAMLLKRFQSALRVQLNVLNRGLKTHGELVGESLMGLQKKLESFYEEMVQELQAVFEFDIDEMSNKIGVGTE